MTRPDAVLHALDAIPTLPRDADGPIFREPWEAQAFAITIHLYERGCFTWSEWAATLGAQIKAAQAAGDPDTGETYYQHWLAALERIVQNKNILEGADLLARKEAWDRAARATPHGEPIELGRELRTS